MNRALSAASTGLQAQQANIERIAGDLANANTDGYKRSRTEFKDLFYQTVKPAGGGLGAATQTPVGIQQGMGVQVGATHKVFEQGPARVTGRSWDLMIEGRGFFGVQMPGGAVGYTRTGSFHIDKNSRVVLSNGGYLLPQITVPTNATRVAVSPEGEVKVTFPDLNEAVIGQLQIVRFQNEEGLSAIGGNFYLPTPASGAPLQGVPGEDGFGVINQGALEGSNVNVASSMVDMITAQRTYEMGAKVMSTADHMLEATVNIK